MKKIVLFAVILLFIISVVLPSVSFSRRGDHSGESRERGSHHAHWEAPESEEHRVNPVPADKTSLEQGGKIYLTYCAACHGEKGLGDGPAGTSLTPRPADLARAGHDRDGELAWKIATGRPPMPAWKGVLTEMQIWQVVIYIKNLGAPEDRRSRSERKGHR